MKTRFFIIGGSGANCAQPRPSIPVLIVAKNDEALTQRTNNVIAGVTTAVATRAQNTHQAYNLLREPSFKAAVIDVELPLLPPCLLETEETEMKSLLPDGLKIIPQGIHIARYPGYGISLINFIASRHPEILLICVARPQDKIENIRARLTCDCSIVEEQNVGHELLHLLTSNSSTVATLTQGITRC